MGEKYLFVKGVKISLEDELKIESGTFNPRISIMLEKANEAYLNNLGGEETFS